MKDNLLCTAVTLPLLPVLFVQGLRLRQQIPRLPEAGGPATGWEPGSSPPIRLIVLGESTVAGVGAPTHQQALTGQIAISLARQTGRAVQWQALGKSGITAQNARRVLVPQLAGKKADVLVIALGGNDVLQLHSPSRWRQDLIDLCEAVQQQAGTIPIFLAGMPPVGQFPAFSQPLAAVVGFRAKILDSVSQHIAANTPNIFFYPVPVVTDNTGFAPDGFHPGPTGYAAWGAQLAECITQHRPSYRTP